MLLAISEDIPHDFERAAVALDRACSGATSESSINNAPLVMACSKLGDLYEYGEGVPRLPQKAVELYQKGCDGGDGMGCYSLSDRCAVGRGVPKDIPKAMGLLRKSCDAGWPLACEQLRKLGLQGSRIPANQHSRRKPG